MQIPNAASNVTSGEVVNETNDAADITNSAAHEQSDTQQDEADEDDEEDITIGL